MDKQVQKFMNQFLKKRERRRKLVAALAVLSMGVVTSVSWSLHMNGESYTGQLYCDLEENHIHSEECYEKELTCGKEETKPEEETTVEAGEGQSETKAEGHVHDDSCYAKTLICGKEENHHHSAQCYSNPTEIENEEQWYDAAKAVQKNEDFGTYVADLAKSQTGYKESETNFLVTVDDNNNEVYKGYTRYGHWFGTYVQQLYAKNGTVVDDEMVYDFRFMDWDTLFVDFILNYSGATDRHFPVAETAVDLYEQLVNVDSENSKAYTAQKEQAEVDGQDPNTVVAPEVLVKAVGASDFEAKAGDLVFFDKDKDGEVDAVGIVSGTEMVKAEDSDTEYKVLKVVEGNYTPATAEGSGTDCVVENEYRYSDLKKNNIAAFGVMPKAFSSQEEDPSDPFNYQGGYKEPEDAGTVLAAEGETLTRVTDVTDAASLANKNTAFALVRPDGKAMGSQAASQSVASWNGALTGVQNRTQVEGFALVNAGSSDTGAAVWYFEQVSGNTFRIYTLSGTQKQYLYVHDYGWGSVGGVILRLTNEQNHSNNQFTVTVTQNSEVTIQTEVNYQKITIGNDTNSARCGATTIAGGSLNSESLGDWSKFKLYAVTTGEQPDPDPSDDPTPVDPTPTEPTTDVPENPEYTTINMFNYKVRDYQTTSSWNEDIEYWTQFVDTGINKNHQFKFGKPYNSNLEGTGDPNMYVGDGNPSQQGLVRNKLENGYPWAEKRRNNGQYYFNESLNYLFDPATFSSHSQEEATQNRDYKYVVEDVKGLLKYEDGYWQYNASDNYAYLPEKTVVDGETKLTAGVIKKYGRGAVFYRDGSGTIRDKGEFFPFNTFAYVTNNHGESGKLADDKTARPNHSASGQNGEDLDHYFGMHLSTEFVQKYDGYMTPDQQTATKFHFSGDDDVWIFIDGVLVADLGGIHQRGGVEIDFSTGKITYYYRYDQNSQGTHYRDWDTTIKAMFTSAGAAGTEVWKGDTFANNTQHTLQMFYLERGGSASNLDVKFNLHTPQPSKLHKSDQYGNPVAGATFEVKDSDGMSFSPKYEATTDANGEFTFYRTGTKTPMSLTDMEKTFGTEFILEETGVPDGYRPVSQQVHLKIEGGMLTCTKPYEEGAWAQTIVKASAPKKLYDKSGNQVYGSGSGVSSGTLFIMPVLRDNGKDTSNQFNDWTPVIGTESLGFEEFEVAKDEDNINQVIAAYKKTVQNSGKYPSYAFKNLASGGTITFEALPGEALEYYDYRVLLNNYRQYDPQNADYKLEFFFTTATSLGGMNANNTYHIDPDSHAAEGRPGFIDIEWAARVEVPDIINVLLFQKTDSVGNIVTDHTAFALYPSDQLLNGDIAYIADGDIPIVLNDISSGDNQGTVKSVNGEAADPADNWHYVVSNDFTLSDQSLAESGGLIREEGAGNILVYKGDVVRYIIKPAQNAYVNPNTGDSDPRSLVGATHGFDSQYPCPELGVGGRGHFAWLKSAKDGSNEYYILREIKAPSGYKIEANETLVVVNDTGVYANAGTAEDNITVYNDPGYLVDPLHKFATNDSIDSTLTWITNDLQVADGTDYLSFSSLASSNKYGTGNSTSTKSHPIAVGSETVSGSPVKVDGLLRNYMTYKEGTISSDSLQGSLGAPLFDGLFSYILNTDRTKPVNKTVDSSVLGVEEGWSALKIYQDTDYGLVNKGTCDYTNLEDKDLSHLYSGGTLVEIKDKVTAKVTLVKTDDKVTNPTKLAGAEFVLLVKKNNTEYYYNNATGKFDTTSIDDAKVFVTVNETGTTGGVEGKDGYFVLPTLVEGTYYLRETNPPTGYRKFTNDIEVKVSVDHSLGPDESPVQKQPMSRGESKPDVKVNKGAADEDATELTKETTGADQPYYVPDGQAGYADFQFKFEVQNSRNGVDVEVNKKKDDSGTKTSLAGAYFVLYRNVPTEEGSTTTKVQYYHKNDNYEQAGSSDMPYTWVDATAAINQYLKPATFNPDEATIAGLWFTGNNTDQSTFRIKGLTPGNYYLKEVKSPDGYALLTQDIEIVVHNDMKVTINSNNGYPKTTGSAEGEISQIETEPIPVYSFDVKNESYELPETGGGYGYPHYLLMGMMLMALPAGYIISRKKRIF